MTTPDIALARRFWMHVHEGGTLTTLDVGRMVTALEDLEHRLFQCETDLRVYMDAHAASEAKLGMIQDEWTNAVYGDLENGVASLNAAAATDFCKRYPLVSSFGETLNRIIDGDTP